MPGSAPVATNEKPFNSPFASLGPLRGALPEPVAAQEPVPPATAAASRTFPRAVVRMERSGRGGKEVTVVDHLDLSPSDREKWLKALKAALGCGGVIEGATMVLQGDHRARLPEILTKRGVKRVTLG
jgi:translation initiation factor 1